MLSYFVFASLLTSYLYTFTYAMVLGFPLVKLRVGEERLGRPSGL